MAFLDKLTTAFGSTFQESMLNIIRVETMVDDRTLVLKDGSLMSMIRVEGALRQPGVAELSVMVDRFRQLLMPYFSQTGHALEINFCRDPEAARTHLERLVNRSKRNARALDMDLDDVLDERVENLSKKMVSETCLISVYTYAAVLMPEERKTDMATRAKRLAGIPPVRRGQVPGKELDSMFTRHGEFVEAVHTGLETIGQMAGILSVKETLQEMRAALYPETYPYKNEWHPRMPLWSSEAKKPGERSNIVMMPDNAAEMNAMDASNLTVETFDRQLATRDSLVDTVRSVRIGDTLFQGFDLSVAPETLPEFNSLVSDISAKDMGTPWRASMRIEAGGVQAMALKMLYLSIMSWSAPIYNGRIRDALMINQHADGDGTAIVKFRMSFCTWDIRGNRERLRRRSQILTGAVKRWGNSGADGISGDPLATIVSCLPGLTTASTAPTGAPPMEDVVAMMPLARQASPWDHGSVLMRTRSGKPWPFQPGSSKQATWISLFVGTPGSGKSVTMNAINFGTAIAPNTAGGDTAVLPRIAITDIGPSSSGLISMIQESLPPPRRHEVLFQKLKMDRSHAINVFDTQLGMRKPLALETNFLINFLSIVCGDGNKPVSGAMRGLIGASIERAYENYMDHRDPRPYNEGDVPLVDAALKKLDFKAGPETIWWEVVDFLAGNKCLHEAEIAQRHAVPTLADLVTASQSDQLRSQYGSVEDVETGQPLLEAFNRVISEVMRDLPILSTYTRYSIGSARIVALDLMDVTGRGTGATARKQTALMFMLARQVMTRDFFVDPDEIQTQVERGVLPPSYLRHHVEKARINKEVPKVICMDEFHRTGNLEAIIDQIIQDAREGRKFNVDIKVASQLLEDFPRSILEVASTLFVCNAGSESSIRYLDELYTLTENERAVIRNNLTGPSRHGAPFWGLFKTKDHHQVRQELLLTLGPTELWAFSTTSEDVALRSRLYSTIGPKMARKVLGARFPGGSAKGEIEARIVKMEEHGERMDDDSRVNVVEDLANELKDMAMKFFIEKKD